jgi:DNA-binding response OmpR family regulator
LAIFVDTTRPTRRSIKVDSDSERKMRLSPTLLLLSDDETLADLVLGIVKRPWKLVRQGADGYMSHKMFAQPNVRLVILDDQAVEENDRNWLLAQIRKHFSGTFLLYVAESQSDGNEKRARSNGAHYYVSKPLSIERFGRVLQSFLQVQQVKG